MKIKQCVPKRSHTKYRSQKEDKNCMVVTSERQVLVHSVHRLLVFISGKINHPAFVLICGILPECEGFVVWDEIWDICGLV